MLLLKLLLVPGLVAGVTLAVRRWGPAVGGWLAGLPVVAGPVLVFYALEQGDAFAARAAHATLTGLIGTVAFALAYARSSSHLPWYLCVAIGWSTFGAGILILSVLQPGLVSSLVVLIAAMMLGRRMLTPARFAEPGLRPLPSTERVGLKADPPGDLPARLVAAATLVLLLTGLAERLGAAWSGLLNAFPVLTTIVAVFSHAQRGHLAALGFLYGYLQSIVGFGLFCFVMATSVESLGLGRGLMAALVLQLTWHALLLSRMARPEAGSGA